jgi:hypothetical protein
MMTVASCCPGSNRGGGLSEGFRAASFARGEDADGARGRGADTGPGAPERDTDLVGCGEGTPAGDDRAKGLDAGDGDVVNAIRAGRGHEDDIGLGRDRAERCLQINGAGQELRENGDDQAGAFGGVGRADRAGTRGLIDRLDRAGEVG